MKKLVKVVLVLGMTVVTLGMNAQVAYSEYSKGKASAVVKTGKSQGTVYLDLNDKGTYGLIIKKGQGEKFITFLQDNFDKFNEWASVAKENNVTELTKVIGEYSNRAYFRYGKWNFGTSDLNMSISISNGKTRAYLYGSKIQSSTNQFIKSESVLFFIDQTVIDELKVILSTEKINKFVEDKTNVAGLFN